jgi:hypothetical protein
MLSREASMERPSEHFLRPMLNTPAPGGTADAALFINRVIGRLDAAHEANKIFAEYTANPVPRVLPLDRSKVRERANQVWHLFQRLAPRF